MKHLTTSEYIERVRTLGFNVEFIPGNDDFTPGYDEIFISIDNRIILSVRVDKRYRMDSDWNGLSRYLSNQSIAREMLVEALLIITMRFANTPIEKRNQRYETSVSSNINIDQLREYQMQIQTVIENETEVDF